MKVLVGDFCTESNENVPYLSDITAYDVAFGDECIRKMRIKEVYDRHGIELIASVFANAAAAGTIKRDTFDYIENQFVTAVKNHIHEIDGIFLYLHGASAVEGGDIDSGDHHILKAIREVTGPYLPIAVCCDPHGNLTKEYVESLQIIRSYRESPHTDADESMRKVSEMLCQLLENRENIHAVYRKLPLILGGEQSVSADEPVRSINAYMNEMEKDPRIMSESWHVGYIRHDAACAGCGIVVVPATAADQAYAEQKADELAKFVWDRHKEFHYTGLTAEPDKALQMVLDEPVSEYPCFLTDSGDNVTSGASGWNTYVLRQALAVKDLKKKFLFCTISDPVSYGRLSGLKPGDETEIDLGMNYDKLNASVHVKVKVLSRGPIYGFMMHDHSVEFGYFVRVNIVGTPIDVMVANNGFAICEVQQLERVGINLKDYDVVVVKEGYIFPDWKNLGTLCVMSLTDGPTLQDTARLPFHKIMRPMYPVDNI
jgi:microcystin degradation protein MlrC